MPELSGLFPLTGGHAAVSGLSFAHKALLTAAARRLSGRKCLVVAADEADVSRLRSDVCALSGDDGLTLPSVSLAFADMGSDVTVSREWEFARIAALHKLSGSPLTFASAAALCQLVPKTITPITLKLGETLKPDALVDKLSGLGFVNSYTVEAAGQFARRGGIIDVFSPGADSPLRIEFFGDEIDALSSFDADTQRRTDNHKSAQILPARANPENQGKTALTTVFEYLSKNTLIIFAEQGAIDLNTNGFDLWAELKNFDTLQLDAFTPSSHKIRPSKLMGLTAKQLPSYGGSLDAAIGDIAHYAKSDYSVVVLAGDRDRADRLTEILRERQITANYNSLLSELPPPGQVFVSQGKLSAGMELPGIKLALITEGAFFAPRRQVSRAVKKKSPKEQIRSYTDLHIGDLVVHDHHGIAKFSGVCQLEVDGIQKDYLQLSYAGTDILYVPVTKLNLVSKYIGAGEDSPVRLNKLNTAEWQRAKTKAKSAARDLAKGLIALYAERVRRPGFAFPADDPWQAGFEEAFPYAETEDQLRSAREIKSDMEKTIPMDRLLCGDVGFGKTEVALRAVMKCVLGGKQAAILVPTTVLAQQHFITATRRFDRYPVRVETISRFKTARQTAEIVKRLQTGAVDVVIGTHRLLQADIKFKDLGLLVVDEEQRFGVSHKEKLKNLARQVDVLTLTATPIPRTLNMALSGIRDMSTIEEAPRDRVPVQTYVLEHDYGIIADAIRREADRGGQVYYLHNRVESIDGEAARIRDLVPGVPVAVAHGKMGEAELSDVMNLMSDGEICVLVCTTIIETGIDIPNVNTLIVTDADKLGLSQLHQLRGRVGRSPRRAYAYFTFRRGKTLSEVSTKRLSAIREFAEFGSGFKIAMRDLEIRGAGNVLGAEQSGQMLSVGYDMYLRLLEEAVLEERGEEVKTAADCTVELSVSAGIPEKYIGSSGIRMDYYRKIAAITDEEGAMDLLDELQDRFGNIPKPTDTLIKIALLRSRAAAQGIGEIAQKSGKLHIKLKHFDFARISKLCVLPEFKGRIMFAAGTEPAITLRLAGRESIAETERLLGAYGGS